MLCKDCILYDKELNRCNSHDGNCKMTEKNKEQPKRPKIIEFQTDNFIVEYDRDCISIKQGKNDLPLSIPKEWWKEFTLVFDKIEKLFLNKKSPFNTYYCDKCGKRKCILGVNNKDIPFDCSFNEEEMKWEL